MTASLFASKLTFDLKNLYQQPNPTLKYLILALSFFSQLEENHIICVTYDRIVEPNFIDL